jgi:ERCC4-related helicase
MTEHEFILELNRSCYGFEIKKNFYKEAKKKCLTLIMTSSTSKKLQNHEVKLQYLIFWRVNMLDKLERWIELLSQSGNNTKQQVLDEMKIERENTKSAKEMFEMKSPTMLKYLKTLLDENVKLQQHYSKALADSDFRKSNQALIEQLFEMTIENKLLQDLIYIIEYLEIKSLY